MYSMEIETHTAFEGVENGINPAMQISGLSADELVLLVDELLSASPLYVC